MREAEIALIGEITAGVTHEFKNVLATIRETSGLMGDLLALSREASFPHREKFAKILTTINKQVTRGKEISGRLNKFAHSLNEPESRVELNALLDQLAFLVQCLASLKPVQLTIHPIEPPIFVHTNPFRFQLILVACLEYCKECTDGARRITLQSRKTGKGIAVRIVIEAGSISIKKPCALPCELSDIQEATHDLGIQLLLISTPGQHGLELILPLSAG
jgi:C4-dicarboxylate-specific signal transduction histidine kinase